MDEQADRPELSFARVPDRAPRRELLRLADGYETSVYVHHPVGTTAGPPVLYLHGIQSHPGWFVGSAAHLAERGHAVFQVTRRGSGDNPRGRGHAEDAAQLLDDVETAGRFALDQTGADRLALLGVSWGGKLLTAYAADPRHTLPVASLTLVAPGIVPRVDVPVAEKLAIAVALLVAPHRRLDIPLSDVALFTDNEPMRAYLRVDLHRLHRATAQFLYASRCLDVAIRRARPGSLTVPTTLILAARDRIIDNAATRKALERLTGPALALRQLDGAHTLEFEPDPTALYAELAQAVTAGDKKGR